MRRFRIFLYFLILIFPLPHVRAQEAVREPVEIGPSGEAYLETLRFRRIDTDVSYFDPRGPAPELKTDHNEKHATGVAVEAVLDDRNIDIDGVARFQDPLAGYAVADNVIHGGADRLWKTAIVQRCGYRILDFRDVPMADRVELAGGNARFDIVTDHIEHVGRQPAGDAHFLLLVRGLEGCLHVGSSLPGGGS